jgi:hypothetical protein
MSSKESSFKKILFIFFISSFLLLIIYGVYQSTIQKGTKTDEESVISDRRDDLYKGLDESGIEPHPAEYWRELKTEREDDE